MSENGDTTHKNLWDAAEVVLRGKPAALHVYVKEKKV